MKECKRTKAYISLDAIEYNFEKMYEKLPEGKKIAAVIKANGYGHGAAAIARLLEKKEGLWGFAVAIPEEAIKLRNAGITKPILILGIVFPDYYEEMIRLDVRMTVSEAAMAEELSDTAAKMDRKAYIHLALDTGMTRIGFPDTEEGLNKIVGISRLPGLICEGMFTHFSRADETDLAPAFVQLDRYRSFANKLENAGVRLPILHCANSAGIMRLPDAYFDMVRAGITLYGIYPSFEVEREQLSVKPALAWKSTVSYVKQVKKGCGISYGATYVTEKDMTVATIPVGYADGYPRGLSNKGHVLIHGRKAAILGRICMDQFMADVTEIPHVQKGDTVTLVGGDQEEYISIEELGEQSGRFSYEFACEISARVPRVYIWQGGEYAESELPF